MNFLVDKKYFQVLSHAIFWLVYFLFPWIEFADHNNYEFNYTGRILSMLLIAVFVYTTYFFLYKGLLHRWAFGYLALLLVVLVYVDCHFSTQTCFCNVWSCYWTALITYIMANSFFAALFHFRRSIISQQALDRIQKERSKAELDSLKAQMNPHFLFNTLNMLYANASLKDEALAKSILQLSDNLHYLMHEGTKSKVSIDKELDFIAGYIALQEARLGEKVKVCQTVSIDNPQQLIPPLLLIPFVENAFKYASMLDRSGIPIVLDICLDKGNFKCCVENPYESSYSHFQSSQWKDSGIGIKNVQQRLALLFPDKHDLTIKATDGQFKVELSIDFI